MKKTLLLLFALLTGVSGAWAIDVTWESKSGWVQASGGKGGLKWFGALTPGSTDMDFTLTEDGFQIWHENKSSDNQNCYIAIAKSSSTTTLSTSEVVAVSNNRILPTASQLYTYTFDETVTLKGGTTYYIVFLTSNTPTDGAYPVGEGRVAVNHVNYGTYTPSTSYSNTWWPYFLATLTIEEDLTNYNYICKNLAGFSLSSGILLQETDPTTGDAPSIDGYTCQSAAVDGTDVTFTYALTTNPLASATTPAGDIATNPKYTTIESTAGNFVYYAEESGAVKGDAGYSKDGDDAHWIIVGDETNGYKLYNAKTGTSKVAVVADGNNSEIQMKDEASNTASLFDIRYISGAYRFYKKGTKWCTNRLSSVTKIIGIHENVNDGSKTVVTRYSKTITYKLKWNDDEKDSKSVTVPTGDDPADYLPGEWDYPYCDLTCDVSYVTTETSTVNVTMTWDGPFEFSTDFESAKWYYLKLNNKYVYYDTESTHLLFSNDRVEDPKALWAFFGNPYDGVKVANLYVGDGMFISNDDPAIMHASSFVENKIGSNAYGFYLRDKVYNCFIGDNGSGYVRMVAAEGNEASSNVTMKVEVSYKYLALSFIDEYTKNKIGGYFEPTQTAVDALKSLYAGYSEITSSDYNSLKSFINAQLAVQTGGFVYPSTGYYRIKSSGQRSIGESYIGYGSSDYGTGLRTVAAANKLSDASTVIKLTGSAGTYKLSTEGLNVQSQTAANKAFPATDAEGVDFVFTVSTPGVVTIRNAASASGDRQGYLHEGQDGSEVKGVVNWQANSAESKWTVEAATEVSIPLNYDGSAYSYGTMYLPFGVTITGAKAYYLTVEGNIAHAVEISEVPANTGVLLRAEGNVSSVTATIKADASAEIEGNKLLGTNVGITSARATGEYILGQNEGQIGFYQRGSGYNIGANKAYLKLDANLPAEVKGLRLDWDNATGIETVQVSGLKVNEVIYNLAGQRLSKVQSGVNIVNGKKLLVK